LFSETEEKGRGRGRREAAGAWEKALPTAPLTSIPYLHLPSLISQLHSHLLDPLREYMHIFL
jgi:hypothetical protein